MHIEIQLSKKKLVGLLFGSLAFVAGGLWMLIAKPSISNPIFGNPVFLLVFGSAALLFFGFSAIWTMIKLADDRPGLVITDEGIVDNSSGVAAGFIPWSDIVDIRISNVFSQPLLMVILRDPEQYISKVRNPVKRAIVKLNHKSYGSAIGIAANTLQADFGSLEKMLLEAKQKHG